MSLRTKYDVMTFKKDDIVQVKQHLYVDSDTSLKSYIISKTK